MVECLCDVDIPACVCGGMPTVCCTGIRRAASGICSFARSFGNAIEVKVGQSQACGRCRAGLLPGLQAGKLCEGRGCAEESGGRGSMEVPSRVASSRSSLVVKGRRVQSVERWGRGMGRKLWNGCRAYQWTRESAGMTRS